MNLRKAILNFLRKDIENLRDIRYIIRELSASVSKKYVTLYEIEVYLVLDDGFQFSIYYIFLDDILKHDIARLPESQHEKFLKYAYEQIVKKTLEGEKVISDVWKRLYRRVVDETWRAEFAQKVEMAHGFREKLDIPEATPELDELGYDALHRPAPRSKTQQEEFDELYESILREKEGLGEEVEPEKFTGNPRRFNRFNRFYR